MSCRNLFRRGLCVLMILCLGCPAVLAEAGQVRYSSEALALSFDVDANSRVVEQYDYVWVYPGADNSNFRLQWVEDGSADEAAYFESIGNSLREAMGDSKLYDPGTAAGAIDLRGIAMDAMVYAYADAGSGQTIEGAYLWEQREGYAILYCAAYATHFGRVAGIPAKQSHVCDRLRPGEGSEHQGSGAELSASRCGTGHRGSENSGRKGGGTRMCRRFSGVFSVRNRAPCGRKMTEFGSKKLF